MEQIKLKQAATLALLHAAEKGVQGKTRLQKLAFLLDEEVLSEEFDLYHFRKYDYGPFSKELLEDTEQLNENGLVDIDTKPTFGGNTRYDYQLTNPGRETMTQIIDQDDRVKSIYNAALDVIDEYNEMALRELLEYVYEKYPEYKENSVYTY